MENNDELSRRKFVKNSLMLAALPMASTWQGFPVNEQQAASPDTIALHWLDGKAPIHAAGTTWGVPWAKGTLKNNTGFILQGNGGENIPVQSWPLAFWPDGSLKWTAHSIGTHQTLPDSFQLKP